MNRINKSKWTKEACMKHAKKFKKRSDWQKISGAYRSALVNGWLEECCKHMSPPPTYWNKKMVKENALKFQTRNEWINASRGAYAYARRNKIIHLVTKHMKRKASEKVQTAS